MDRSIFSHGGAVIGTIILTLSGDVFGRKCTLIVLIIDYGNL